VIRIADHGPGILSTEREKCATPLLRCEVLALPRHRRIGGRRIASDTISAHGGRMVLSDAGRRVNGGGKTTGRRELPISCGVDIPADRRRLMTSTNATAATAWRTRNRNRADGSLIFVPSQAGTGDSTYGIQETTAAVAAKPVSYPAPARNPRPDESDGAAPNPGRDRRRPVRPYGGAAGGFVEYYARRQAPRHGEEKHYGGSWEVRGGDFCTRSQDSDGPASARRSSARAIRFTERDGEEQAARSARCRNPQGLKRPKWFRGR